MGGGEWPRILIPFSRAGGAANRNSSDQQLYITSGSGDNKWWALATAGGSTIWSRQGAAFSSAIPTDGYYTHRGFNTFASDGTYFAALVTRGSSGHSVIYAEDGGEAYGTISDYLDNEIGSAVTFTGSGWHNLNGWPGSPKTLLHWGLLSITAGIDLRGGIESEAASGAGTLFDFYGASANGWIRVFATTFSDWAFLDTPFRKPSAPAGQGKHKIIYAEFSSI
jgi:hypothetical protein